MKPTQSLPALVGLLLTFSALSLPAAATRVWSGAGADTLWSNPANWTSGIPVDGDSVLLLRHPLSFAQNAVNDLTNLTLVSIRCEALGYTLVGGTLRITSELLMGGPVAGASMTIRTPVEIPGPTLQIVSTNSSELGLSGLVSAPPGVVVTIDGGIRFGANPAGAYQAETRILRGFLPLLSTRLSGPLIVGGQAASFASIVLQSGNAFANFPPLTILSNGAVFNISTFNSVGPLTVDGGVLRLGNRSPKGDITVNGNALLKGGASVFVTAINSFGPGELSVTGSVTIAGCSLAFQPGSTIITKPSVIVRNDGNDPVIGTFTDLPEGSVLTNDQIRYTLSYVGGDGNDITLSPIIEPAHIDSLVCLSDGLKQISVQGQPGFLYVVEATEQLFSPPALIPWQPIHTNGTQANGQFQFIDPDTALFSRRFYRVVSP